MGRRFEKREAKNQKGKMRSIVRIREKVRLWRDMKEEIKNPDGGEIMTVEERESKGWKMTLGKNGCPLRDINRALGR